jgi:multicopper oxidase
MEERGCPFMHWFAVGVRSPPRRLRLKSGSNWLFHCHKPMHMEGGMITLVKIA